MSVKKDRKEELYSNIIQHIVEELEQAFKAAFSKHIDDVDEDDLHDVICNILAQLVLSTFANCSGKKPEKIKASVGIMAQLLTDLTPHYTHEASASLPSDELGKLH